MKHADAHNGSGGIRFIVSIRAVCPEAALPVIGPSSDLNCPLLEVLDKQERLDAIDRCAQTRIRKPLSEDSRFQYQRSAPSRQGSRSLVRSPLPSQPRTTRVWSEVFTDADVIPSEYFAMESRRQQADLPVERMCSCGGCRESRDCGQTCAR